MSVTKNMNLLMNVNIILIILCYFHYSNDCLPIEYTDFLKLRTNGYHTFTFNESLPLLQVYFLDFLLGNHAYLNESLIHVSFREDNIL